MMARTMTTLTMVVVMALLLPKQSRAGKATHQHSKKARPSDFLVTGLEDIEPAFGKFQGDMYAGMIPIGHDHSGSNNETARGELMFWLFAPDQPAVPDTLTIWFNGGPGCSSFSGGVLFENSPITVPYRPAGYCCSSAHEPLEINDHAWTKATYMLYVEQPAHTGFSWGIMPKTEDDVADDFVDWLQNFYNVFADLYDFDLFLFGESYAGMYVPSIAHGMYQANMQRKDEEDFLQIPLRGIGVGNGWMDLQTQGPAVADFAYWHGMIDVATRDYFQNEWQQCFYQSALHDDPNYPRAQPEPFHAFTTGDECGIQDTLLYAAGDGLFDKLAPNTFDVTSWDTYPVITAGATATIASFYNNQAAQAALHAPVGSTWHGCQVADSDHNKTDDVEKENDKDAQNSHRTLRRLKMLDHDRPLSMLPYIAELLDSANIRVLIYNADLDLSVSAQGSEAALNRMEWNHGGDEWLYANRSLWIPQHGDFESQIGGYAKEVDNLSFVIVRNSGHLVPYNVPRNALDMVTRFIKGDSFGDQLLPNFAAAARAKKSSSTATRYSTMPQETEHQHSLVRMLLINALVAVLAFAAGVFFSRGKRRQGYQSVAT